MEYIVKDLKDPSVFLYFNFLNLILPTFTKLNLLFQRDTPTVHLLYDQIIQLFKNLRRYFCRQDAVDKADLMKFDPMLTSNHLPLNQIYLGAAIHGILQADIYSSNQDMVYDVRSRCRNFMITMCQQLQKRFYLNSTFWYMT